MKIIFTICSNNYLAQAKALGDSIVKTNPCYQFFIGLVDTLSPEINYEKEIGHPIILCDEIGIPNFDSLWKKYNIIELNTCVKPFYLEYFINKYDDLTHLMYFDPDTFVYQDLAAIERELMNGKEIILTPHVLTPIPLDGKPPSENTFLNYGIFNLGFIGVKNPRANLKFITWWSERTYKVGFSNVAHGFFVDQLWLNLAPIFFQNTVISFNYGLNMAPWNLHERILSSNSDKTVVNGNQELVFFHFSSYDYTKPEQMSKHYSRYTFENRPDLIDLYGDYHQKIVENNIDRLSKVDCSYVLMRKNYLMENSAGHNQKKKILSEKLKLKVRNLFRSS